MVPDWVLPIAVFGVFSVIAMTAIVAGTWSSEPGPPADARRSTMPDVRRQKLLELLFVGVEGNCFVLDAIVGGPTDSIGEPVTLRLATPEGACLLAIVTGVLERWASDSAPVLLDLGGLARRRPSVTLRVGETAVSLETVPRLTDSSR